MFMCLLLTLPRSQTVTLCYQLGGKFDLCKLVRDTGATARERTRKNEKAFRHKSMCAVDALVGPCGTCKLGKA